jgi:hypothetical protein
MNDKYTWQVRYSGDTWVLECDDERPDGRGFGEVEHAGIRCIDLIPAQAGSVHSVLVPDGASPVFFRRRSIELNAEGEQGRATVHCIGWKQGEHGVYLFVFDNGSCLLSNDLQAV